MTIQFITHSLTFDNHQSRESAQSSMYNNLSATKIFAYLSEYIIEWTYANFFQNNNLSHVYVCLESWCKLPICDIANKVKIIYIFSIIFLMFSSLFLLLPQHGFLSYFLRLRNTDENGKGTRIEIVWWIARARAISYIIIVFVQVIWLVYNEEIIIFLNDLRNFDARI